MNYWHLTENPTHITYQQMMDTLCTYADRFYFVTRQELDYDEAIIARFNPYLIRTYETKRWAGTVTSGPPATIYEIAANEHTSRLLQQLAESLFDWVAPSLPEDLTFLKEERIIFSSTTHEKMGCFELNAEEDWLLQQIQGLQVEHSQ